MKQNNIPMRRCAVCMESKPKTELIRISCYQGKITIDHDGKADGRGMYICKSNDCLSKAKKRRVLNRNFGALASQEEIDRAYEELSDER